MTDKTDNVDYIDGDWVYDEEVYPNIFTLTIIRADGKFLRTYEISDRMNDIEGLLSCLRYMIQNNQRMVGFNNLGFDYPIVHEIILGAKKAKLEGKPFRISARDLWLICKKQIESFKDGFGHTIKNDQILIKQLDLFKLHHFDNKAKSTGLKMLEFNMRSENIEDLPYKVGSRLTIPEMSNLVKYNIHDVNETLKFYRHSLDGIRFRAKLSEQYGIDFTNYNDTKIGKEYFIMRLEEAIPGVCYGKNKNGTRKINQTKRQFIRIKDCLFNYFDFQRPEFIAVHEWFSRQVINETKGVFTDIEHHDLGEVAKYAELVVKRVKLKSEEEIEQFKKNFPLGWIETEELKALVDLLDENGNPVLKPVLKPDGTIDEKKKPKKIKVPKKSYYGCRKQASCLNVVVDGFRFDFGTGGIHGSVSNLIVREDKDYEIVDADVSSMYPNIAISNRVYPKHLTEKFCDIYEDVYNQRKSFPKGSPENAVMKLALNGTYGESNNEFSPLYDPQFTMTITIGGQLTLCLLAEKLLKIEGLELIQANTDGLTVKLPRKYRSQYDQICTDWQKQVKLELEFAEYKAMYIRDCNNYIAEYTNGKVKRKGAYQYEGLEWHKNQSSLVIQMAAESEMLKGVSVEDFVKQHASNLDNKFDFMLRTKVQKSSRLVLKLDDDSEQALQNICRYYPSNFGGKLIKYMPALKGEEGERPMAIDKDYKVLPCNNANDFDFSKLNLDYYINEANKLVVGKLPESELCCEDTTPEDEET